MYVAVGFIVGVSSSVCALLLNVANVNAAVKSKNDIVLMFLKIYVEEKYDMQR